MNTTPATIHVVDDDPSFRAAVARLLRAAGYQVVVHESGHQLLANPPGAEAGCILLDMRMLGLDGLDVQERLNAIGCSLPVLFLTGHGSVESSVQAIKAGAEDVLTKPVSKATLVAAIERVLVRYRERIDRRSELAIPTGTSSPADPPVEPAGGLDARFCEVMDVAPVMIWVSGPDKQCIWFNRPWLAFTGRGMQQEVGNGWAEGVHPKDFDRCLETYVSHFDARKEFRMEYRLRRHDGIYRWIDDTGIPRYARDGSFLGYIGSCTDIHDYRETQSELRRRLIEIARLTRRADAAAIASLFAHELNQPLAAILSNLETAELEVEGLPAPVGALSDILVDIRRDNLRAAQIIRQMQNLLRSEEPEVQRIDLNDVVGVVHEILKPHAAEAGVEMKVQPWQSMLAVRADPAWLQQVVLNLALNAMEATVNNFPGRRLIVMETRQAGQSKAELSVSDTGTGIPAQQLASIFEPFASKRGGSGLGLSTSRGIVEAFGGKIWAENNCRRWRGFSVRVAIDRRIGRRGELARRRSSRAKARRQVPITSSRRGRGHDGRLRRRP
jgi:PAS domain S-box-containing protein